MVISLKNCLESAEIISVLKCFAYFMLKAVLPIAVGPTMAIKNLVMVQFITIFMAKFNFVLIYFG
jgi:hypothetical protein